MVADEIEIQLVNLAGLNRATRYGVFGTHEEAGDELYLRLGLVDEQIRDWAAVLWTEARVEFNAGRDEVVAGLGTYMPLARPTQDRARGLVFLNEVASDEETRRHSTFILRRMLEALADERRPRPILNLSLLDRRDAPDRIEKLQLIYLLTKYAGNRTAVARHLKLNRDTLYYRLNKHNLSAFGRPEQA